MKKMQVCQVAVAVMFTSLSLFGQATPDEQKRADEAAAELKLSSPDGANHQTSETVVIMAQSRGADQKKMDQMMFQEKTRAEAGNIIYAGVGLPGDLVTGKPFAAEAVTETVQTLADGNRIVHRNVVKQYRDQSGRTRREQNLESLGQATLATPKQTVFIHDPVAKVDVTLDTETRTAMKLNSHDDLKFLADKSVSEKAMPAKVAGDQIMFRKMFVDRNSAEKMIQTVRLTNPASSSKDVKKEDLGKQTLEGVECTGTRTTFTIPAGAIGNDRPIVTTTETWYSPDLSAVVESKTVDPRFGETNYSLRSVQRGEQPLSLFEIPADYKTDEQKKFLMMDRVDHP